MSGITTCRHGRIVERVRLVEQVPDFVLQVVGGLEDVQEEVPRFLRSRKLDGRGAVDLHLFDGAHKDARVLAAPFFGHMQAGKGRPRRGDFSLQCGRVGVLAFLAGGQEGAEHEAVERLRRVGHGHTDDAGLARRPR